MIRSDLASAGVIFTLDTETGFPSVVFISASYGLGESVVQGEVDSDEFYVFKSTKTCRTSSGWPLTETLCHICAIFPSGFTRKVLRATPIYSLPRNFLRPHLPYDFITSFLRSLSKVTFKFFFSMNFA